MGKPRGKLTGSKGMDWPMNVSKRNLNVCWKSFILGHC